jgi:hypothetical protein
MILTGSISGKYTKANNKTRVKWLNAFELWMVELLNGCMVELLNGWMVVLLNGCMVGWINS